MVKFINRGDLKLRIKSGNPILIASGTNFLAGGAYNAKNEQWGCHKTNQQGQTLLNFLLYKITKSCKS